MARSRWSASLVLVGALVLLGVLPGSAAAGTITRVVDDDGHASVTNCDATRTARKTIQGAINASGPGDTVLVCPGTYRELLSIESGKNGLKLDSVVPRRAIVRPPVVSGAAVAPAVSSVLIRIEGAQDVRVRGLKLLAPTTAPCMPLSAGILVAPGSDGAVISGNLITATGTETSGNTCPLEAAIDITNSAATVSGNTVQDFLSEGIIVRGSDGSAVISRNTVHFWHASQEGFGGMGYGIHLTSDATGSVVDNQVVGLSTACVSTGSLHAGIYADAAGSNVAIRRNLVRYARTGIFAEYSLGFRVTANTVRGSCGEGLWLNNPAEKPGGIVRDNLVRGYAEQGIYLENGSGMVIDGNDVAGAASPDCRDNTRGGESGAPHYGTLNSWTGNIGLVGDPAGICTP